MPGRHSVSTGPALAAAGYEPLCACPSISLGDYTVERLGHRKSRTEAGKLAQWVEGLLALLTLEDLSYDPSIHVKTKTTWVYVAACAFNLWEYRGRRIPGSGEPN